MKEQITREREGPVQRAILAWLTQWDNGTILEMAAVAFEARPPTIVQIKSVQRAVKRLIEDEKIVESPYRAKNGQKRYSLIVGAKKREPKRQPRKTRGLTVVK